MHFLSAADTEAVSDWPAAIACIQAAYASGRVSKAVPGRLVAAERSSWIRCMPAIPSAGRFMGTKQISRTREGKVVYVITLLDKESGELAFLIDAIAITAMRTAATSAVAVQALCRHAQIDRLAIIGSGLEARSHLQAIASVKRIGELAVYSPTPANRARFAEEAGASLGIKATACASPQQAVEGATVIIAAARSRDESPTVHSDWIGDKALVVSIGSTTASQREVDISVVDRAELIVSDEPHELGRDTGDMIAATEAGIRFDHKLCSLYDLVQNKISPELCASDLVMFKSVGSALQDISFAEHIAIAATEKRLGQSLEAALKIKQSIGKNG
jgi:ornithine cyclodeaminase/alanine dehydrogenase